MDANIPMSGTACGVCALSTPEDNGVEEEGVEVGKEEVKIVMDGEGRDLEEARRDGRSLQVFVYNGEGNLMLAEGEGACSIEEWVETGEAAGRACAELHEQWLRKLVEARIEETGRWMRNG